LAWRKRSARSSSNTFARGLTESEAKEYGLPVRDYTLRTPEEKIVTYADWLVDIYTDGIVPGAE
jgi:hypothetical protein